MKITHTYKTAISSLTAHKTRSLLTILGIVIGVLSIILIVSLGQAARELIAGEITSLGADIIWIEPGKEPEGPIDFAGTLFSDTLKDRDIEALRKKSNAPKIIEISPSVNVPGSIAYAGETYRPIIIGFSAEFMGRVFDLKPEQGVYFDDVAIRNRDKVAVIGAKVKKELFGELPALGKTVKINEKSFRVVGILPDKGQIMFFDIGNVVIIPYTTAKTYILGIDHYNEVWVRAESAEAVPATVRDVKTTLRDTHGIDDPDNDDFYILTQDNLLDQVGSILNILTAVLTSIVAIALVVGGVGIMNIMLVSVTERTQEIGLRKALGATYGDILKQFLIEAVILTGVGGIIGILGGATLSFLASVIISSYLSLNWTFIFPVTAAIIGFAVSCGVGLIFGLYPARQAANLDPIEAMRYE